MVSLEEKINEIGSILADMQLDINLIKRHQKELKDLFIDPDKLAFERHWRKAYEKKD